MKIIKKSVVFMVAIISALALVACGETECKHEWKNGKCEKCETLCMHEWENGVCKICGTECGHKFTDAVCEYCGMHEYVTGSSVPTKYRNAEVPEKGTVVSEPYTYNGATKEAYVYLPYGYSENTKYNVLYLLHGAGEAAGYWFKQGSKYAGMSENITATVLDNMIYYDLCEPLIVVTPTTYDIMGSWGGGGEENRCFRDGLVPAIETKYSTYANGSVTSESLIASRTHRAMAGFSMGGMTTYTLGIQQNLDIMSWFGCYTGSGDAASLLSVLEQKYEQYPIDFFYNGQGTLDIEGTRSGQMKMHEDLMADGRFFTEDENYKLIDKPNHGHKYACWIIDLFNTLSVCFFK